MSLGFAIPLLRSQLTFINHRTYSKCAGNCDMLSRLELPIVIPAVGVSPIVSTPYTLIVGAVSSVVEQMLLFKFNMRHGSESSTASPLSSYA